MPDFRTLRLMVPAPVRRFPADLAVVVCGVGLALLAASVADGRWTPIRVAFGFPLLFVLPGYALVAALFPERSAERASAEETADPSLGRRISLLERGVLSVAASLALVPLVGMGLNFTAWGIRPVPVLAALSACTVALAVVAAVRRWNVPADDRFRVPVGRWYADARAWLFDAETTLDTALNVAIAVSVLLAAGSVTYAVASPKPPQTYTEFYLLNETDDGTLVADEYPHNVTAGNAEEVVVGVQSHENERTNYTVVAQLQRVAARNGSADVIERRQLDAVPVVLSDGEARNWTHEVTPTTTGRNLRLQYLLYRGDPPADPRVENAYREIHLWLNVTRDDAGQPRNAASQPRNAAGQPRNAAGQPRNSGGQRRDDAGQ